MRPLPLASLAALLLVFALAAPALAAAPSETLAAPLADVAAAPQAQLQTTYFFAEGSTNPPFDTWVLLFNPNSTPIRVLARFFLDTGPGPQLELDVPGNARRSLFADQFLPGANFGAAFFLGDGAEFVVERSMFFGDGAHNALGATAPTVSRS